MSLLYRGSVKDLHGPYTTASQGSAIAFEYSDAFSVFDWGRMPDLLPEKGAALATLAAWVFSEIEKPETWKEFSRSPGALQLRKGNRWGAAFNELGEQLQREGLRTHYLGVLEALPPEGKPVEPQKLGRVWSKGLLVKAVTIARPHFATVLGRTVADYSVSRSTPEPRLIPLEVVFRFSCPPGSSLLERAERDPGYLATLGYPGWTASPTAKWDLPVMELFTKLEPSDRVLSLSEAVAISGVSAEVLQGLLLRTAWVAGWLKSTFARHGLELADGKLEWGTDGRGGLMLVDAVGPDELRLLAQGVQVSKECLRAHYRATPWYKSVSEAKERARAAGHLEWKKGVTVPAPALPAPLREMAAQVYRALTQEVTGIAGPVGTWSLDKVLRELSAYRA